MWKFDLSWPYLDLTFAEKFKKCPSYDQTNVTIEFYGQNGSYNMHHMTRMWLLNMVTFLDLTLTLTLTLTNLQPWYPTNYDDTECCSSTLSMQAYDALDKLGHVYIILIVTSLWRHFIRDWNKILTQQPTYTIVCVCQVSCFYSFGLLRYREEENGGKKLPPPPPATGGWRRGPSAAELNLCHFF